MIFNMLFHKIIIIILCQLFRHGDRNPTETYPKDPYINYTWPNGWGALTKVRMKYMDTVKCFVHNGDLHLDSS